MPYSFRPALPADLDAAFSIASAASKSAYSHWDEDYPSRDCLREDIEAGELFLLTDEGEPCGIIAIMPPDIEGEPPFPWQTAGDKPCMLSRLGIHPAQQGRGLAARIMHAAQDEARRRGYRTARLLASADNPVTNHIYLSLGYAEQGRARLWDEDFIGYELTL